MLWELFCFAQIHSSEPKHYSLADGNISYTTHSCTPYWGLSLASENYLWHGYIFSHWSATSAGPQLPSPLPQFGITLKSHSSLSSLLGQAEASLTATYRDSSSLPSPARLTLRACRNQLSSQSLFSGNQSKTVDTISGPKRQTPKWNLEMDYSMASWLLMAENVKFFAWAELVQSKRGRKKGCHRGRSGGSDWAQRHGLQLIQDDLAIASAIV